jgi:hypothetical protein
MFMKTRIIIALACTAIMPLAFGQTVKPAKPTNKANPMETRAATPAQEIQTVTEFKVGEPAIQVQSSPQNKAIKYLLAKNVRFVDKDGKAIDPHKIRPGTQVRLENKSKGRHGMYRRVVVVQTQ